RISIAEYLALSTKTTTGRPTLYKTEKDRDNITVTLWPVPDRSTYALNYYSTTKIEDVTAMGENIDLPPRYLNAVINGLAWMLCDYRRVEPDTEMKLEMRYETYLKRAMDED